MKIIALAILVTATIATNCYGQGVAYYASSKFTTIQCNHALRAFDKIRYPIFGHLWSTFGMNTSCIKRFIDRMEKRERPYQLRIYFQNETCHRAGRICARDEIGYRFTIKGFNNALESGNQKVADRIRDRATQIQQFLFPFVTTSQWLEVVIVQGLEDNWTTKAANNHLDLIKEILPYEIFRNPVVYSDSAADGVELHDQHAKCPTARSECVYNNDGYDVDFGGPQRALNNALSVSGLRSLFFGKQRNFGRILCWWNTQGIVGGKHVPPRRRRIVVVRRNVFVINKILKEIENGPANSESYTMDL